MNDNAEKWIAALRSGKFKQTRGFLRREDKFCCLGVACEVYRRETGLGEWSENKAASVPFCQAFLGQGTVLPSEVKEWLGLALSFGQFENAGSEDALIDINDAGESFEVIADIIESEPRGLFTEG